MSLCTLMMSAKANRKSVVAYALCGVGAHTGVSTNRVALPAAVLYSLPRTEGLAEKLTLREGVYE
jgi:hypothetical protein